MHLEYFLLLSQLFQSTNLRTHRSRACHGCQGIQVLLTCCGCYLLTKGSTCLLRAWGQRAQATECMAGCRSADEWLFN